MSERSGLYGGRGCILREATNYNGEAIHTHTPCHHDWAELSNVCSGCSQARPSQPIGSKDRHSTNSSHDGISIQPMELELMTAKRTQGPQFKTHTDGKTVQCLLWTRSARTKSANREQGLGAIRPI